MSKLRALIKPTIFTVGVCGTCFIGSAIANHEYRRSRYKSLEKWVHLQRQRINSGGKYFEIRQKINDWKNGLTTAEKVAGGTIFINFLIFCAWRSKSLRPIMTKYFLSHTDGKDVPLSSMILSTFSHSMPLHLIFNMFVIYSFSNLATAMLGPEQLIGLYISAGTVSSLSSLTIRLFRGISIPSLGASGAILGILGYVCTNAPETKLLLFFVPIEAGNAIKLIVLVDFIGILARWRLIDHAAHLGGSLFGIWYAKQGQELFNHYRRPVVDAWLKIKG